MATGVSEEPGKGCALILDKVSFKQGDRTFGPYSMHVRGGSIVGLLGPNGAGKSSLVRVVAGTSKPLTGVILAYGSDITPLNRSRRQNAGVFVCLHDRRRFRPNRSMLEVVTSAVSHTPQVLVLDEPFNGLEGVLPKQTMMSLLKVCRDSGTAVLITDHDIRAALRIVDRAYLVQRGKITAEGNPDELLGRPDA